VSILGNRVLRREDPALLMGAGCYTDDLEVPNAAFVAYVRSTIAHGVIESVDTTEAQAAPGVLAVVTAADISLDDLQSGGRRAAPMARPVLARGAVHFVGEPIAAVVAETAAQAVDAAEMVWAEIDPRPAIVDVEQSLDADPIFEGAESNVCVKFETPEQTADFGTCEVVVRFRTINQRVAACPIEPRVAAAWWGDDGRLVVYTSCQGAHPVRDEFARAYGLDKSQVRVVCPDVGGGFGAKSSVYPEQLLLPDLARRVGRPVRWFETRTENMLAMGHGRAQLQDVTIGGNRDGTILAYRLEVVQDAGGYPALGAVLPFMTRLMATGCYAIDDAEFTSRSVVTSTTPTVAYRGAGRPEAATAIERAVDRFAASIDMDPVDVRRRNLVPPDAFPYTTATGTTYDVGNYVGALERVVEAAGYADLRAEQARRRAAGDPIAMGIGIASYVEITALEAGAEFGSVELRPDGTVLARTGSNPYGQGHHTSWAMLISDRLGIPMDRIEVVHGDTDAVPSGGITGGSRSAQLAGSAIADAAEKLRDLACERAADLLEANPDDVVLDRDTGTFHVTGSPAVAVGWAEVGSAPGDQLVGLSDFSSEASTFPFGCHLAVVEVDTATGDARLRRHVACDDAGTIINPLIVEGQVHGGIAQGVAQALFEAIRYDEDGNPLTTNFADYSIIAATELPSFERIAMETPTPLNPLGVKGIGESGTIGSTPAVQNAVIDALAHLGVEHIDMPCTPERVWRAIQDAQA
jgi:carbon-monoxide dehydrogenase large subunit